MDLTKYYPDIVAKYPAYVTKRELCEICHICPKTAYNLEQQGEIGVVPCKCSRKIPKNLLN